MTITEAHAIFAHSMFHPEPVVREAARVIENNERAWYRPENGLPGEQIGETK